jgi:hypothetical protein
MLLERLFARRLERRTHDTVETEDAERFAWSTIEIVHH